MKFTMMVTPIAILALAGCVTNKIEQIAKCDDVSLLEEIAINAQPSGKHGYVGNTVYAGLDAVKKIENRASLEKVRDGAQSPTVRKAAADRLAARTEETMEDGLVSTALNARPSGTHDYVGNTFYDGMAAIVRLQELGATNSLKRISGSAKMQPLRTAAEK